MDNLFTNLPRNISRVLPYKSGQLELLEHLFLQYVPLDAVTAHPKIICTPNDLRRNYSHIIEGKSPRELTWLAIQLCKPYFEFLTDGRDWSGLFVSGKENVSLPQRVIFDQYIFGETGKTMLLEEVSELLLISYFYHTAPTIGDVDEKFRSSFYDKLQSKTSKAKERYESVDNYKRQKSIFEKIFLLKNKKNIFTLECQNIYDVDFLASMLKNLRRSINPFVLNSADKIKARKMNIFAMLNQYCDMFDSNNEGEDVNTIISKNYNMYNQYILERLSAVNFLNSLIKVKEECGNDYTLNNAHLKRLGKFVMCPLLNYRAFVLESIAGFYRINPQLKNYLITEPMFNSELTMLVEKLTKCTLPIVDIAFRYLVGLQYNQRMRGRLQGRREFIETIRKEFNDELTGIATSKRMKFFHANKNGITPVKSGFSKTVNDQFFWHFYINFFEDVAKQRINYLSIKKAFSDLNKNKMISLYNYKEENVSGIITDRL